MPCSRAVRKERKLLYRIVHAGCLHDESSPGREPGPPKAYLQLLSPQDRLTLRTRLKWESMSVVLPNTIGYLIACKYVFTRDQGTLVVTWKWSVRAKQSVLDRYDPARGMRGNPASVREARTTTNGTKLQP
jgi:hypothetical protein